MRAELLVAGIGNVFLSDDGFGVEAARRLEARRAELPAGVEIADVGIRGMHLAYRLLDGYRTLVLLDTAARGGAPGSLYLLEHDLDAIGGCATSGFDAHGMDPASVLAMLDDLANGVGVERPVQRVLVVGCEPACLDEGIGLSEAVAAVVDRAVQAVLDLVQDLIHDEGEEHDHPRTGRSPAGGGGRGGGGGRAVAP
ncbi:MAG TPA: hydrogenase maturation protease [Pseudonocardia sp.]|jgi:hydrogenase maturation protease|nr:hydrogenase maturation protease [Pseudonocardia sp.]